MGAAASSRSLILKAAINEYETKKAEGLSEGELIEVLQKKFFTKKNKPILSRIIILKVTIEGRDEPLTFSFDRKSSFKSLKRKLCKEFKVPQNYRITHNGNYLNNDMLQKLSEHDTIHLAPATTIIKLKVSCDDKDEMKEIFFDPTKRFCYLKHKLVKAFKAPKDFHVFHKDNVLTNKVLHSLSDNDIIHFAPRKHSI